MILDTSKRLVIAIDCDDVILESGPAIISAYNKRYGTHLQLSDFYGNNLKAWDVEDDETAIKRVNEYMTSDEFMNLPPTKEAIETLTWLSEQHELHLVTGRPDFMETATRQWLLRHMQGVFASLEFTNFLVDSENAHKTRSKADVCKQLGADILIDDHLHHAKVVAEKGIPVILFGDLPWNQADELPKDVMRMPDWGVVREFFDGQQ